MPLFCSLCPFFLHGQWKQLYFLYLLEKAFLIGINIVEFYGLHNEDFEKPIQVFYEDNNFPVVTLNDPIDV